MTTAESTPAALSNPGSSSSHAAPNSSSALTSAHRRSAGQSASARRTVWGWSIWKPTPKCSGVGRKARVTGGVSLLTRYRQYSKKLVVAHETIRAAYKNQEAFGADAEWLLDNFHIIEDALRKVAKPIYRKAITVFCPSCFPGRFAVILQHLTAEPRDSIAHCDSSLDENNLTRFVQAYQSVQPLTIGELWAVPIMLPHGAGRQPAQPGRADRGSSGDRLAARAWRRGFSPRARAERRRSKKDGLAHQHLRPVRDPHAVAGLLHQERARTPPGHAWLESCLSPRGDRRRCRPPPTSIFRPPTRSRSATASPACVSFALDWPAFFERASRVERQCCARPGRRLRPGGLPPPAIAIAGGRGNAGARLGPHRAGVRRAGRHWRAARLRITPKARRPQPVPRMHRRARSAFRSRRLLPRRRRGRAIE